MFANFDSLFDEGRWDFEGTLTILRIKENQTITSETRRNRSHDISDVLSREVKFGIRKSSYTATSLGKIG